MARNRLRSPSASRWRECDPVHYVGLVADAVIHELDAEFLVTSDGQRNFGGTFRKANARKPSRKRE